MRGCLSSSLQRPTLLPTQEPFSRNGRTPATGSWCITLALHQPGFGEAACPSPGPSISPVAAATRPSGGGGPLASPPRAVSTPTSFCDSASTASLSRALRRQSASKEPIHALRSAGGGSLAPPGRLVENCESEAPPTPRPRRVLRAAGQGCALLAQVDVHLSACLILPLVQIQDLAVIPTPRTICRVQIGTWLFNS